MAAACVTDEGVYKIVVVGGGPSGIGVFIRAARTGFLRRLLDPELYGMAKDLAFSTQLGRKQKGIAVLHAGDAATFGSGNLGAYAINSNTFARSLVASILDEKPELDPPESIKNTFLEGVRSHESSKRLEEIGVAPASLVEIGRFLNHVGRCVLKEVAESAPQCSKCLLSTVATKYEVLGSGLIRVEAQHTSGSDETVVLYTEHLVLATGGVQDVPALGNPAYQAKLFSSDACLRVEGFAKLKEHLLGQPNGERKVCIVGGSHSSFSVAWLLLNKFQDPRSTVVPKPMTSSSANSAEKVLVTAESCQSEKKREESESMVAPIPLKVIGSPGSAVPPIPGTSEVVNDSNVAKMKRGSLSGSCESAGVSPTKRSSTVFKPKGITILHRSPIRCYYGSRKEAEADGADGSRVDRSGCVNTFTGLREDAKRLFKSIKAGRELRVRLFQVNQHGCQTVTSKSYEAASAIVWGAGYKSRVVPGFDAEGKPLRFQQSHGTFKLDAKARLQSLGGSAAAKTANVLGLGLGFSLRSAVDEMGMETRADGVTVYHRRGATLVLEALFGSEVYGSSTSFEEMVDKNDKKRLAAVKPERPKNAEAGSMSPSKSPSFRSGSVSASSSPTKVMLQVSPIKASAVPSSRPTPSKPVSSTALVGEKTSKRAQEDAAPTNPPVKLLLLRRRISADAGGATSARSPRPAASPPRCREPSGLATATDSRVPLQSHVT